MKILFIILGTASLALGIIGIGVPGLPTTPFILLSAALYLRSSKKMYLWLLNHPIVGRYIQNYQKHKAFTLKTKIFSITLMWLMISCSVVFFIKILFIRVLLVLIGLIGTWFMGKIPVYKK